MYRMFNETNIASQKIANISVTRMIIIHTNLRVCANTESSPSQIQTGRFKHGLTDCL